MFLFEVRFAFLRLFLENIASKHQSEVRLNLVRGFPALLRAPPSCSSGHRPQTKAPEDVSEMVQSSTCTTLLSEPIPFVQMAVQTEREIIFKFITILSVNLSVRFFFRGA